MRKINIFGNLASVNRLTIWVNRLTRVKKASVGKFLGVNRLTRVKMPFLRIIYRR